MKERATTAKKNGRRKKKKERNQRKLWGECKTAVRFQEMGNHVEKHVMK